MPTTPAAPTKETRTGLVGLEQRVLARFRRLRLPVPAVVIVGFSGGSDSLALAAVLARIGDAAGLRSVLVHVDHGLRPESVAEQRGAAELAAALGLPFRGRHASDDPRAVHPGVGLEEAARRERYRLLARQAAAEQTDLVALAHHQTDQAETVLLHLIRGAGTRGAAGMGERTALTVPWWSPSDLPSQTIIVWRPFIDESRAEITSYADRLRLVPIADPSNDDLALRRNALRHEALPLLERISPGATAALARFGRLAADDDATLTQTADDILARAIGPTGELLPATVAAEPLAIRRRVVRRWLQERVPFGSPTADRTEAVVGLLEPSQHGRRVDVGEGFTVVATSRGLRVERPAPAAVAQHGRG